MKTVHIIDDEIRLDMTVLAINSHVRGYSLCWHINKKLCINFIKKEIFIGENKESLSAFEVEYENKKITLVNNRSKKGALVPEMAQFLWENYRHETIETVRKKRTVGEIGIDRLDNNSGFQIVNGKIKVVIFLRLNFSIFQRISFVYI